MAMAGMANKKHIKAPHRQLDRQIATCHCGRPGKIEVT